MKNTTAGNKASAKVVKKAKASEEPTPTDTKTFHLKKAHEAATASYLTHEANVKKILAPGESSIKLKEKQKVVRLPDMIQELRHQSENCHREARVIADKVEELSVLERELSDMTNSWESNISRLVQKEVSSLEGDLGGLKA